MEAARELGYVATERTLWSGVAYPLEEEREVMLKRMVQWFSSGHPRASDMEGLQELFYSLTERDNYSRFFKVVKIGIA